MKVVIEPSQEEKQTKASVALEKQNLALLAEKFYHSRPPEDFIAERRQGKRKARSIIRQLQAAQRLGA